MKEFRKLKASEIEARVSTITDSGCSLLLYKDARVDQKVLDETVGCLNWQRSHQLIGDRLYCTVSVWDADKEQWISKQDVGTESYTEKEKGQASDSFKRACFNLGIGRELYTAPYIWVPTTKVNLVEKNGKKTTYDRFEVEDIAYDEEGNINRLVIRNVKMKVIAFQCGTAETEEQKTQENYDKAADGKITETQYKSLMVTIKNNPDKVSEEALLKKCKVKTLKDLTVAQLNYIIRYINGGKE